MSFVYITAEEILRLHFRLIEDYGGSHGVRDEDRLKSVVAAPRQEVFGEEQYPTVFETAAVYLRNIITDHMFIDGNKRTAVTMCAIFLMHNKKKLSASPKALEGFAIAVVTGRTNIAEIAGWLERHTE